MSNEKVLAVIPARYGSTRFPGKPLAQILGKPMIQWVYERSLKSKLITKSIVATDDQRIFLAVKEFGGEVEMTSPDLKNGSERAAAVADKFQFPIVVNIQGDEPLIDPKAIDKAVSLLIDDNRVEVGTLVKKISDETELKNPNLPKVVMDNQNYAIYFSRAIIPFFRDQNNLSEWIKHHRYVRHIGLYVYRYAFLKKYVQLPESTLEKIEKLEQLRILENGYRIKVAEVDYAPRGVDTPDDLQQLIEYIQENQIE
jgi:3-deoxy-manno-octulosonate cytidylyltransferase (CMP-KDO synthetase)